MYESSANLSISLPAVMTFRSAALTTYEAGPMLDHCMTLAVILCNDEVYPLYLVRCEWPLKKSTIQLYTLSGMSS